VRSRPKAPRKGNNRGLKGSLRSLVILTAV